MIRLRQAQHLGIIHLKEIDWYFRVYLMRGDVNEVVDRAFLFDNLRAKIRVIAAEYLSSEFKYVRSGFILAHYGRRGVTYSFWHWADWGRNLGVLLSSVVLLWQGNRRDDTAGPY